MNFLPEIIETYAQDHSQPEPDLLKALTHETWQKVLMPRMLSGHLQGRFLSMISHLMAPSSILEIGTYTGYSAICLAEGLAPGGKLITIDINDELQWIREKYFGLAGLRDCIESINGNALEIISALQGPFDLVFIDADKENYLNYFNKVLPKMKPGGLILADNVLWSGKVLTPPAPSDLETRVLREFNEVVVADHRVQPVLLPLRDGLMCLRLLQA
ncbi:MAG: O-methyltransferase [Flavobacteriales bacterium]|nr:O-methyltransferase [Flavobacteriales bacterium]